MSMYNKTFGDVWKEQLLELAMDDADLHIEATNNTFLMLDSLLGFSVTPQILEDLDIELAKHGYSIGDHDVPIQLYVTLAQKIAFNL